MKRKVLIITASIVAVIVAIIVALALSISPIAKSYIEKHSKELIGRKVLMKDLKIDLFSGSLHINDFKMYEKDDKQVFASVDSFYVNLSLVKLLSSTVQLNAISFVGPSVEILQKGDSFNFDDIIKKLNDTTNQSSSKSSFPKTIVIKDINISDGVVTYTDLLLKNTIKMENLGVSIPKIAFNLGNTDAGIHLKIGKDATLSSQLAVNLATNKYKVKLSVRKLPIDIIKPYMKEYFNIGQFEGLANGDLEINGDMDHIMNYLIKGTVDLTSFNLTNSKNEPIVKAAKVSAKIDKLDVASSNYIFDYIHGSGVTLDFILHPKTDNFTALFKETSEASDTTEAVTFKVKDLHIVKSNVVYTDNTLRTKFKLPMSNVDFHVKDYSITGTNEYNITASFPKGGKATLGWKADMENLKNQEIMIAMNNISLPVLSPYCLEYTAYDITSGNMNFESRNKIKNDYINSFNTVDVYKMNVGKKHKDMKVEYNMPLKLGLYILKDKDDKIKFDIPVKGNINDPQFSYRKIVLKTLVNLMVKLAVSPVRFLSGLIGLGGGGDDMTSLKVDALQSELTPEQFSKLDNLVKLYQQKPDFNIGLTQYVDLDENSQDFITYLAKRAYLTAKIESEKGKAPQIRYEDVQNINDNDQAFQAYIDGLMMKRADSLSSKSLSLNEKIAKLYVTDSIKAQLTREISHKNMLVRDYLITNGHIPATKISVLTAPSDSLSGYKGKSEYKINMHLNEQ